VGNNCEKQTYNHNYTIDGDELYIIEKDQTIPYKAKFNITEISAQILTIKLFWTSQETPSGGIDEDIIPEAERPSYTYYKVQ